jgi:hypothetical protein
MDWQPRPSPAVHIPRSTVSAWLPRLSLNRPPVTPPAPVERHEWPTPVDLLHVDIKPLGLSTASGIGCMGIAPAHAWDRV